MTIGLVDDRPEDRRRLMETLSRYAAVSGIRPEILAFSSGEALLRDFRAGQYALIFLDVLMGEGMTGIQTAEKIRETDDGVLLVFLTESEDHQAEAIHWHVFDYLNKDNLDRDIFSVMDRILHRRTAEAEKTFAFTSGKENLALPYRDLVCVTADRNYLLIRDRRGSQYRTRMTFAAAREELCRDPRFLQVLRGVIVNMDELTDVSRGVCTLRGEIRLPVNLRDSDQIERMWTDYTFAKIRRESREEAPPDDA